MAYGCTSRNNAHIEVNDDLTMTIELTLDETEVKAEPSRSGKTVLLATTGGAQRVVAPTGKTVYVNLSVYRYP